MCIDNCSAGTAWSQHSMVSQRVTLVLDRQGKASASRVQRVLRVQSPPQPTAPPTHPARAPSTQDP